MKRHEDSVRLVMKRGVYVHNATHIRTEYRQRRTKLLTFEGLQSFPTPPGFRALLSFDGPSWAMTGEMRFFHYDTEVLTVNFDDEWITDHGYFGHSTTTDRNLREWMDVLDKFLPTLPWDWKKWTTNWRDKRPIRRMGCWLKCVQDIDDDLVRFRARVPWLRLSYPTTQRGEMEWRFYWRKYDDALADAFWVSKEFLSRDLNRRYFKYDWQGYETSLNAWPHHWVRSFISADAERRWRAREKRNGRVCPPT